MPSPHRHVGRPFAFGVLAILALVTLAVGACQQPAPAAAPKPKRHSFEDSGSWQPAAAPAPPSSGSTSGNTTGDVNAQAQQVKQSWEQAHQAPNEAEAQRRANEALNQTQQMADQPPPH
jgi:hypothetical protein